MRNYSPCQKKCISMYNVITDATVSLMKIMFVFMNMDTKLWFFYRIWQLKEYQIFVTLVKNKFIDPFSLNLISKIINSILKCYVAESFLACLLGKFHSHIVITFKINNCHVKSTKKQFGGKQNVIEPYCILILTFHFIRFSNNIL